MRNPALHTISGLNLSDGGIYYINVRAIDGAGLQTDGSSGPITVIKDSPLITQIAVSATPGTMLITTDAVDSGSTIVDLACALVPSPQAISQAAWTEAVPGQQMMLETPFDGGTVYYAAVRATNALGIVTYQVCGVGYDMGVGG